MGALEKPPHLKGWNLERDPSQLRGTLHGIHGNFQRSLAERYASRFSLQNRTY